MSEILYKDAQVTVYKEMMVVNRYYFPLATSKTIMFSDLETVELKELGELKHRWGIIAKTHLSNWFNYDDIRRIRGKYLEFKLKGRKIMPSITCNDPEQVKEIIWANCTLEGREYSEKMSEKNGVETELAQAEMMERMLREKEEHDVSEQVLVPGKVRRNEEEIEA